MRIAILLIALAVVVVAVACTAEPSPPTLRQQWQAEANDHGVMGRAGSFHLEGNEILTATSAPLVLSAPFVASSITVAATLPEGSGFLRCNSPTNISAGSIDRVIIHEVRTSP